MERVRRYFKLRRWRKVVACFLTCCIFLNTSLPVALATPTPTGGGFTVGIGTITQDGNTTTVGVGQIQSVIEWDSLNTLGGAIDKRETLAFLQGDRKDCAVLNRVSGSMTKFGGDLVGHGMRIFMVNPAGIMFEKGATVNVTQLVASGLGMTNEAFDNHTVGCFRPGHDKRGIR